MGETVAKRQGFLRGILQPSHTAVVTMELQNGVIGEGALMGALADEVQRVALVPNAIRLCDGARSAGARVVHCTIVTRRDGAGTTQNSRISVATDRMRRQGHIPTEVGTAGAEIVAGLWHPNDVEVARLFAMTPFTSSPLDQLLRNLGVRTVVAAGVSLNLGVLGLSISAVDLGYQVVIPRDAVAGVPAEYAASVLEHTLSLVATIASVDEVLDTWA